jgi:hypothetical protein
MAAPAAGRQGLAHPNARRTGRGQSRVLFVDQNGKVGSYAPAVANWVPGPTIQDQLGATFDLGSRSRAPRQGSQSPTRRAFLCLICLVSLLGVSACAASGVTTRTADNRVRIYRDPAGWAIDVPARWHVIRFSDSNGGFDSAGAQISNVRLPVPAVVPGNPIQVNGRVLAARGLGLIIATDRQPGLSHRILAVPPLSAPLGPKWSVGSALAGAPYIETLWFRGHGETFIASAKVGPKAGATDLKALAGIIHSLRLRPAGD